MNEQFFAIFEKYSAQQLIIYTGAIVLFILLGAFMLIGYWGIFNKTGEKGWKVFIPGYNLYVFSCVCGKTGARFLLLLVPVVNLVYLFLCLKHLAKRFEKGVGFALGLFFIPGIFALILGFGKAQCIDPIITEEEPYYYYYKPKY